MQNKPRATAVDGSRTVRSTSRGIANDLNEGDDLPSAPSRTVFGNYPNGGEKLDNVE